jgi:flagellar biosynthesis GTPase FlhF
MKKTEKNKIEKILNKNKIELSYDSYKQNVYINGIKYNNKDLKKQSWFSLIKGTLQMNNDEDILRIIIELANENSFNSNEIKIQEKKEQEKQKQLEKEKRQLEKEKQKQLEREQKERQKQLENEENERKLNKFIEEFNYEILDKLPKSNWINSIKVMLDKEGLETKPISYQRIINQYTLNKAIKEQERYEQLGYVLNSEGKIDEMLPVNYAVFFDNFFLTKEQWDNKETSKDNHMYCYWDSWQDTYNLIENGKIKQIEPEKIRTIVRQYSPIKNVYVVNDMYKDWIRENREDNSLLNEIKEYPWDGIDRLGIDMNSNNINDNENIFCKILCIDNTVVNKKMICYSLLHAMRQIIWPARYNFQHILSLVGDTNCGKTKTLQDLFTFKCGKYYCGNLDIDKDAEWTIGEKLSGCVAVLWNEKKGINKAANEVIKNFIDLINDGFKYQKKHEQVTTPYVSHNICFITFNPKQSPLLTDYSVSYEKRYFIEECKQTEEGFKQYLNTINNVHDQIWAQLYKWCLDNENVINELNEKEINELKEIQIRNKGIQGNDIEDKLHFQFNIETYITKNIVDIGQFKNSKDFRIKSDNKYPKYTIEFISNGALQEIFYDLGFDSRHISIIKNEKIMEKIGFLGDKQKKIDGRNYKGWRRNDSTENPILFEQ